MWRTILASGLLAAVAAANAQQVDYVKRSDLWSYSMGKEAGQLGAQAAGFNAYLRGLEQQRHELEELKQRLVQCASCADRGRLAAEVTQLEDKLDKEEGALCGSFMAAQEDFNPAVGAMNKLFGVSSMCARLNDARTKAMAHGIYREEKERFAERLKAGDVTAYNGLAMITKTTFGHLPEKEQLSLACPYWFKGAELGDRTSMGQLMGQCLGVHAREGERQEAFDMVKRCSDRGDPHCIANLATFYASPRQASVPASVVTNDKEALRLWDMAAAKDPVYAKGATALRVKLGLATAAPPEPRQPLPGEPAPWVLREGRYIAKGKDAQGRPYEGFCTIVAQGNDRYQFSWQIGSVTRTAAATVRGSRVELDAGSGRTQYLILNTSGMVLLSSPNENLTLNVPSASATTGVAALPQSQSQASERVVERIDPKTRRCASMAKTVEQFRARAEERPDQWARSYEKARQDYSRQCPAQ